MSIEIKKISNALSTTDKISQLNDMLLAIYGKISQFNFDLNEIDALYSSLGLSRKYLRNQELGHTLEDYSDFVHYKAEVGYSIWKIQPSNYLYSDENQLYFDDKILTNMKEATSETSTFDKVFLNDGESGGSFIDNTTEASTEEGTPFDLMNSTTDYLYLGLDTIFNGAKFEFYNRGMGYDLVIEYYSSESGSWKELTINDNNLDDNTNNFASDGLINWDLPIDWDTIEINGETKYWVRISTIDTPTTIAKAYYIVPGNSVESLLALSSSEIMDESWKWCYYNGYIYLTIRNSGQSNYEGLAYITSSSSATNKQNYFCYNHTYKANYLSSLWESGG